MQSNECTVMKAWEIYESFIVTLMFALSHIKACIH